MIGTKLSGCLRWSVQFKGIEMCLWSPGSIEKWSGVIFRSADPARQTQASITVFLHPLRSGMQCMQTPSLGWRLNSVFKKKKSTVAAHYLSPGHPAKSLCLSLFHTFTTFSLTCAKIITQGCVPGLVLYQIKPTGARLCRSVALCMAARSYSMWRLSSSRVWPRRNNAALSRPGAPGLSYACELVDELRGFLFWNAVLPSTMKPAWALVTLRYYQNCFSFSLPTLPLL